jgi:hypothetical protein
MTATNRIEEIIRMMEEIEKSSLSVSQYFKESLSKPKDHPDLRLKGKFTSKYNNSQQVRESRFKHLDEKIDTKRFDTMRIFSLSRESIKRHTLALFSLPLG